MGIEFEVDKIRRWIKKDVCPENFRSLIEERVTQTAQEAATSAFWYISWSGIWDQVEQSVDLSVVRRVMTRFFQPGYRVVWSESYRETQYVGRFLF